MKIKNNAVKNSIAIKEKLAGALELPKEIVKNLPLISITGNEELFIENYKGIIEYTEERIRINTTAGVMRIEGNNLLIKQMTEENIIVNGRIIKIEYLY